jgi:hypothetical protein
MTEANETAAQPAVVQAVLRAPPAEQHLLLSWSRGLGAIRCSGLPAHRQTAAMLKLTRDLKATWPLLKVLSRVVKRLLWDARSWKFRLGVGAVIATFAAIGNSGAEIVSFGGGIGLPIWVAIGLGGLSIGLVADLVAKKLAQSR